ncbi:MAG: GTP cyclohydrolase II [Acetobacteraceae bacterium]|nr:GTP cyclohydrolase II [Acetobacteraceae bacterium]
MPPDPALSAHPVRPDPIAMRLRTVHRAVADLRRGTPVLLEGATDLVALAAETASARGLGELASLASGAPVLLLSAVRAATVLRRPVAPSGAAVAFRTAGLLDRTALRSMADPTAPQLLPDPPELAAVPKLADAALALTKLGRLLPAAVVAPARAGAPGLASAQGLLAIAAEDVLAHPDREAAALVRVAEANVPLEHARDARVVAFRAPDAGIEHLAIVVGEPAHAPEDGPAPLVRLHSECFTGDLLGSLRCDCGPQLRTALRRIGEHGTGVLLYLAQEGRGIGLPSKLRAYALQDRGLDTIDANRALGWNADERNFLVAATMLGQLGMRRIRLLTNNLDKLAALAACGVEIAGREPLVVPPNGVNDHYLATKARRFGHLL